LGIDGLAGVTAIETRVAAVMVRAVEAAMEPEVAVIVAIPNILLVASPWLPAVLLRVATVALEELQVTRLVTFCVLPSVKVPVAVNCCVVPAAIDGLGGLRATDLRVAGLTVKGAVPLTELAGSVAVMVAVPVAVPVANPWLPATLLTAATGVLEELQLTKLVRTCFVLSV
jgi:hypothetical protein